MFGVSSDARSDIASDLASLRRDVARLAESLSQSLRDQTGSELRASVDGLRRSLGARVPDSGETGRQLAGEARERVADANARLESRIGESPLTSVLVAARIGFVLGLLSRGRP